MSRDGVSFPLIPRHRLGLAFGTMHGARRGLGLDIAGARPYRPGDDVSAIDWAASARLSAATDRDEFLVRERFADEASRVVALCDRRAAMALYPPGLPWLRKPDAMHIALDLIARPAPSRPAGCSATSTWRARWSRSGAHRAARPRRICCSRTKWGQALGRAGGQPRQGFRVLQARPAHAAARLLRLRPLRLPRRAARGRLGVPAGAPVGRRTGARPGSDLGSRASRRSGA